MAAAVAEPADTFGAQGEAVRADAVAVAVEIVDALVFGAGFGGCVARVGRQVENNRISSSRHTPRRESRALPVAHP